jgi:phenylacetate-CoA ligase
LFIIFVGENVPAPARRLFETAFGCRSYEDYGSTENGVMAVQCREGWLHYNADWHVLEPVDTGYRPVPAGTLSDTVLVTNLTNRVMPGIRYDQTTASLSSPNRAGAAAPTRPCTSPAAPTTCSPSRLAARGPSR